VPSWFILFLAASMSTFKLTLAYDGSEFSGWQRQPERRTVEGELERAWLEITGEEVRFSAAGRTDAGVHAAGQVAGVESTTRLPPETLVHALDAQLPPDVAVRSVQQAPDGFHATHDAKSKRYRYVIYNDPRRPVFYRHTAWHIPAPLNVQAMHLAGQALAGKHDFASFQSAGSPRESTVRTIFAVDVARPGAGQGRAGDAQHDAEANALIFIEVEGDGFLYNMVRSIVGTLVAVGRGKRPAEGIGDVLAARDRTAAGETAPAHGLSLLWVRY
jgi:tRNA pseudouridine38-40 synthase